MKSTTKRAYAKINLGLDVVGTRPNGYHDVRMVMQTLDLCDEVIIEIDPAGANDISMVITSGDSFIDVSDLPTDEKNLCVRAAMEILDASGKADYGSILIKLKKCIPFEAGLGGGSADAAEVLIGLNELLELGLTTEELCSIGAKFGADIPFAVQKGTMLAEGIGEELSPIGDGLKDVPILLVKPPFGASTGAVYSAHDALKDPEHPDIDGLMKAISEGDIEGVAVHIGNSLEGVTIEMHPLLEDIKKSLTDTGALSAMMTGSGTAVFGIFRDEETRNLAAQQLKNKWSDCFVSKTKTI